MPEPLAYFLTWTTYGARLHGDVRGTVDRDHNKPGTPALPADEARVRGTASYGMRGSPYLLATVEQRSVVLTTIQEVCAHRGWTLWAAHVRTNHVHVLLAAAAIIPEKPLADLKSWCSRRLREAFDESRNTQRWAEHGSTRYLNHPLDFDAVLDYVYRLQGEPMADFINPNLPYSSGANE